MDIHELESLTTIVLNLALLSAALLGWREFNLWKKKLRAERTMIALEKMLSDVSRVTDKLHIMSEVYDSVIRFLEEAEVRTLDFSNINGGLKNAYQVAKIMEEDFSKIVDSQDFQKRIHDVYSVLGEDAKHLYWKMTTIEMYFDFLWQSKDVNEFVKNFNLFKKEVHKITSDSIFLKKKYL